MRIIMHLAAQCDCHLCSDEGLSCSANQQAGCSSEQLQAFMHPDIMPYSWVHFIWLHHHRAPAGVNNVVSHAVNAPANMNQACYLMYTSACDIQSNPQYILPLEPPERYSGQPLCQSPWSRQPNCNQSTQ